MKSDPRRVAEALGVSFDWTGLKVSGSAADDVRWVAEGDVHVALMRTRLPAWPDEHPDRSPLREPWRATPSLWGAFTNTLLECEVVNAGGCEAIRVLTKEPFNFSVSYQARLVPLADPSVTLLVWAVQHGIYPPTGLRDRVILERALARGELRLENDGRARGFYRDLYDPVLCATALEPFRDADHNDLLWRKLAAVRSIADDASHDAEFPDHALTKVRRLFDRIVSTMRVDIRQRGAPAATIPEATPKLWFEARDGDRRGLAIAAVLSALFGVFAAVIPSIREWPFLSFLAFGGLALAGLFLAMELHEWVWPRKLTVTADASGLQVSARKSSRRIAIADLAAFCFDPLKRRLGLRLGGGEMVAIDAPTCAAAERLWYALGRHFPGVPREVA